MEKVKNVLITGGSGLIGRHLTALLQKNGYVVSHLGRTKRTSGVKSFVWDPARGTIEPEAIYNIGAIIHLAGAGIADVRWTSKRKREILDSRRQSTRLLSDTLQKEQYGVSTFISASGISYYGLDETKAPFTERDPPADDFMARVTIAWEHDADVLVQQGIRVVKLRTGVVLSGEGGALKKLETPIKLFLGAPLGTGEQYVNWIHIDDLCSIYLKAIVDTSMHGAYNAVSPNPVTNKELTRELASALRKPLWLPPVPAFAVRLLAGEVAELVLKGGRISSGKIESTGFNFRFKTVHSAIQSLYGGDDYSGKKSGGPYVSKSQRTF
jgi:uncharacterized protein (TIGR01777 family)